MNTEERRQKVLVRLEKADKPVTGTALAREFQVSRQIIVGDISIIRAMGKKIYATPRGYLIPSGERKPQGLMATLVCEHTAAGMQQELEIIVDHGGHVHDVIVEHPLYGEIRADLLLFTRRDVDAFVKRMTECEGTPLSTVTRGVHLHTIEVPDENALRGIRTELKRAGILAENAVVHRSLKVVQHD